MAKKDVSAIEKDIELFLHTGESGYDNMIRKLEETGYPEPVRILRANRQDALAYLSFPFDHWRVLYTSNIIENVNSQLKRRTKKIGSFPSEEAAMRLLTHLLMRMEAEETIRKTPLQFAEQVRLFEDDAILMDFASQKQQDSSIFYFS